MKRLYQTLALLLIVLLGMGGTVSAAAYDMAEADGDWERLLSFATEEYTDWDEDDTTYQYLFGDRYDLEKNDVLEEYSLAEYLRLYDFNQAQFAEILPFMPQLSELWLRDCDLQDYSPLLGVPSLEILGVEWSEGLPEHISTLAQLPALETLILSKIPADADLSSLLPVVSKLTLSLEWRPDLPEQLATLPGFKTLDLSASVDADLSPLAILTDLEALTIQFHFIEFDTEEDNPLPVLPKLPALRALTLNGDGGGWGSVISILPDLPALEEFDTDAAIDLELFQHCPALRVLSIPGAYDFSPLNTLKALEEIHIEWFFPDDLSPLYDLPALRLLQIAGNHADPMEYLDQLEELYEAVPDIEIVIYSCC